MINRWSHLNGPAATWEVKFNPRVGHVVLQPGTRLFLALYDGILLGKYFTLEEAQLRVESEDEGRKPR